MTTITHTPDGPRFDGMTLAELADAAHDEAERLWNKREFQETSCVLALAAAALRHLSEWQPIETAPMDGTEVILWWPHWSDTPVTGSWMEKSDQWFSEVCLGYSDDDPPPTHWRPLPPGPGAAP
jgi:hypothetical protein